MKRGTLNFLGRKNQSLFDTNIKPKDLDNVELVLNSPTILESGTASVRARPTVKHHASSESFQGFAVPTPKVPLLPPLNGLNSNGSVDGDNLSNGSVISVPDPMEGEIFIPPPPSMVAPLPPGTFILPPPDFMGEMNSSVLANLPPQGPSAVEEEDFSHLRPPEMAPPKPPSTCSSGSSSSIPRCSPPRDIVPEHPKFAPPQPPTEKLQRSIKSPPPKPIRMSSIPKFDLPPQSPAPPPPVQTPTRSTFNPQNTAKLYNVPKTSFLSNFEKPDTKPKQMLVLEDSGSATSSPVKVETDGRDLNVVLPPEPVPEDTREQKETKLQISSEPNQPVILTTQTEKNLVRPKTPQLQTLVQRSPEPKLTNSVDSNSHSNMEIRRESPTPVCKFSPLIDHKLRNLKNIDSGPTRDVPAASPLALLMAAKERDKHRSSHSLSRENSDNRGEQPSTGVYSALNAVPQSSSYSSLTSTDQNKDSFHSEQTQITVPTLKMSSSHSLVNDHQKTANPVEISVKAAAPSIAADQVGQKQNRNQIPPKTQFAQPELKEEVVLPVLPPPPEFDDLEEFMEPPPSIPPPDPPQKRVPLPPPPAPNLPPSAPFLSNLTATKIPKPPPPALDLKPKPKVQTKPQKTPTQLPSPLSPKQATLLSILQKKMLEMDQKMVPVKEAELGSDDWGSPLSDEEGKIPAIPKSPPLNKTKLVVNKPATLDMKELEGKVAKKNQELFPSKAATSNGPSKQQYGMTFKIRPGTSQPITPVARLET